MRLLHKLQLVESNLFSDLDGRKTKNSLKKNEFGGVINYTKLCKKSSFNNICYKHNLTSLPEFNKNIVINKDERKNIVVNNDERNYIMLSLSENGHFLALETGRKQVLLKLD